jgi:glycosyltransferase involved in cell wall biosynthesis
LSGAPGSGPVVLDLQALQATPQRGGEAGRYASRFVESLELYRPDVVGRYLLAPGQPSIAGIEAIVPPAKIAVAGEPGSIPATARVYHALSLSEIDARLDVIWPAVVEHLGLRLSATVFDLTVFKYPHLFLRDDRQRRRYRAQCQILRFADALLTVSETTRSDLIELLDVHPSAVTAVGSGRSDPASGVTVHATGPSRPLPSWRDVVGRAAEVFDRLAAPPRRPWTRPSRLAFVSPFPPVASGVANYSGRLVEAVAARLAQIAPETSLECFADGLDGAARHSAPPDAFEGGQSTRQLPSALSFPAVERAIGGYDRVVSVLGNSQYHAGGLAALRDRRGVVIAHELRLTNLMRFSGQARGAVPARLAATIQQAYGDGAMIELRRGSMAGSDLERLGVMFLRDIVADADLVLVTSHAALRLAQADVGPELASRLGVLPFAIALDDIELALIEAARTSHRDRAANERPLLASFGIVDPAKLPRVVVEAAAILSADREIDLVFVGPVSDDLVTELGALATEVRLNGRITCTGTVDRTAYLEHLGRATVAVQLRAGFGGEASAAAGDCLAAGLPTIVSDTGWLAELPDNAVVKVGGMSRTSAALELAGALQALLDDPARMSLLGAQAAAYAAERTFDAAATTLLDALDLDLPSRR